MSINYNEKIKAKLYIDPNDTQVQINFSENLDNYNISYTSHSQNYYPFIDNIGNYDIQKDIYIIENDGVYSKDHKLFDYSYLKDWDRKWYYKNKENFFNTPFYKAYQVYISNNDPNEWDEDYIKYMEGIATLYQPEGINIYYEEQNYNILKEGGYLYIHIGVNQLPEGVDIYSDSDGD